eukprot:6290222-Prymnesium_polylepis.1
MTTKQLKSSFGRSDLYSTNPETVGRLSGMKLTDIDTSSYVARRGGCKRSLTRSGAEVTIIRASAVENCV